MCPNWTPPLCNSYPYIGKSMRIELYIIIMKLLVVATGGSIFLSFSCSERKEGYIRKIIIMIKTSAEQSLGVSCGVGERGQEDEGY